MLNFEVNYTSAKKVEEALRGLDEAFKPETHRKILRKIGLAYLGDTLKRFKNQHNPDRKPWATLKPVTVYYKTHGMKGRGRSVDSPERRGVWTEDLYNSINFRIEGNSVIIGTDVEYAPFFHYGVKRLKKLKGSQTAPWGIIPPRRFLGRNTRIDQMILKIYNESLREELGMNLNSVSNAI